MTDFETRPAFEADTLRLFWSEIAVRRAFDEPEAELIAIRRAFTGELHSRAYTRDDLIQLAVLLEPLASRDRLEVEIETLIRDRILRRRKHDGQTLIEVNY